MSALNKTLSNISPRARLMMIMVAIVGLGSVFAAYKMFSSSPTLAVGDSTSKNAISVNLKPEKDKIDKARPDQEVIIPADSPIGKELKDIRQEEITTAKKSTGSYVEALRLKNQQRVITKIDEELSRKPVSTGMDDVLSAKKENEFKRREALLQRREELATNKVNTQQARAATQQSTPFDEELFLDKEVKNLEYKSNTMAGYSKQSEGSKIAKMSDYQPLQATTQNSESRTSLGTGGNSYTQNIITPNSQSLYANETGLNNQRGLQNSNQGKKTNYEDLVNPVTTKEKNDFPYITVGTMYYAILEIGVNTDELSPVRATIVQEGPLKNAVFVGEPERVGEKSMIVFKSMSVNGKDYSVSVVALDPDTMRTGLADDVDNHTFERYFKLATASVVAGYAEAMTGSSTRTYSDGSKETVIDRLPKASDQAIAAAGKVGSVLAPKFEKEFDRPPTITVNGNRDLGLMFMSGIQL